MFKILKIPIKDTTMPLTGKSTWGLSSNVFLQSSYAMIEWNWYAIAITPINRSMFFKIIMWWGTEALLFQIMSKLHLTASFANVTSTTHSHQDISHTKITWKHIPTNINWNHILITFNYEESHLTTIVY